MLSGSSPSRASDCESPVVSPSSSGSPDGEVLGGPPGGGTHVSFNRGSSSDSVGGAAFGGPSGGGTHVSFNRGSSSASDSVAAETSRGPSTGGTHVSCIRGSSSVSGCAGGSGLPAAPRAAGPKPGVESVANFRSSSGPGDFPEVTSSRRSSTFLSGRFFLPMSIAH